MFLPIKCPVNEQFGAWLFNCRQVIQKNVYHQTNYSSILVQAIEEYDVWIANEAQSMTLYLLAVEGSK